MENTIIAICGKDGTGKSTLAGELAPYFGNCSFLAFATELRERCILDGHLTREKAYAKPTTAGTRRILRQRSQAYKDRFGHNIWASALVERVPNNIPTTIIHDMRYALERSTLMNTNHNVITLFVGDANLTDEQKLEPSFADLPQLYEDADILLPANTSQYIRLDDLIKTIKGF